MIRQQIEKAVAGALAAIGAEGISFTVERPGEMTHGDYATNAALATGKVLKKNPKEVAESLKKELEGKISSVEKIEVAGAGFINFFLSREAVLQEVQDAAATKGWGEQRFVQRKERDGRVHRPEPV